MRVFITGLTGTLGTALAKLHHQQGDQVWGCARSEGRAVEWLRENSKLATLFLCDANKLSDPYSDIGLLLPSMDRVYHCAAMKHVDLCEQNPLEAVYQNVSLTDEVAIACENQNIPMTFISSDKACMAQGVYGATKLLAERVAIRHGAAVVRLGNLVGSSGSVFAKWKAAVENGEPIRLTDGRMTRYFIGVRDAALFVMNQAVSGKVVIPHPLRSTKMGMVADAVARGKVPIIETGKRPGETTHQWLVAPGDKMEQQRNRLILADVETGQIGTCENGLNSYTADVWNVDELLKLAGRETWDR